MYKAVRRALFSSAPAPCVPLLLSLLLCGVGAWASLDLTIRDCGVSLGNSPRLSGLRLNAVDRQVQSVNGLNLTLWNPAPSPDAAYRGAVVGLVGPKGRTIDGLALGGLGAVAEHRFLGLGAATLGIGTDHLWGAGLGLYLVEARKSLVGAALAGYSVDAPERAWGLAASGWHTRAGRASGVVFGGGLAQSQSVRGLEAGTLATTRSLTGMACGLVFAGVEDSVRGHARGLVAGGLAASADTLTGVALGGLFAVSKRADGVVLSPLFAGVDHLRGLTIGLGGAVLPGDAWGIGVGGLGIGTGDLVGAVLSAGYAGSEGRVRGLLVGGVGGFARERLDGVAVSLGGVGSAGHLRGIVLSGLVTAAGDSITGLATGLGGVWAGDCLRGVALGGVTCLAPAVVGVSTGLFNGAILREVNLEEFLVIYKASQRHTGLAIGLVNYTRNLHGVQLGLLNWAGNNPRWLRLLPLVNIHA
ncbi:MAG: hypothetical protein ABIL09_25290 [Gemmatimonadota bacterium]